MYNQAINVLKNVNMNGGSLMIINNNVLKQSYVQLDNLLNIKKKNVHKLVTNQFISSLKKYKVVHKIIIVIVLLINKMYNYNI